MILFCFVFFLFHFFFLGGGGKVLTNSLTCTSFSPVLEFVNQLTLAIKTQIVGHLKLGLNARKMINNNHNNKYNLDRRKHCFLTQEMKFGTLLLENYERKKVALCIPNTFQSGISYK